MIHNGKCSGYLQLTDVLNNKHCLQQSTFLFQILLCQPETTQTGICMVTQIQNTDHQMPYSSNVSLKPRAMNHFLKSGGKLQQRLDNPSPYACQNLSEQHAARLVHISSHIWHMTMTGERCGSYQHLDEIPGSLQLLSTVVLLRIILNYTFTPNF